MFKSKFYAVSMKSHPNVFLCYCTSRNEAKEYVYNFIKVRHHAHFSEWCRYKDLDENDWKVFYQYFNLVIDEEEKQDFLIHALKYKKKDLAAILRMFAKCIPLNCSFETSVEHTYFNTNQKNKEKINDILEKFKDELKDSSDESDLERLVS